MGSHTVRVRCLMSGAPRLLETMANALVVTLALPALYPDTQEWGYQLIADKIRDRESVCSELILAVPLAAL